MLEHREQAVRRKNSPSVCDNSSFTVNTNNLQASPPLHPRTRTTFTFTIFIEKWKAPRPWSAKTNLAPSLYRSSPCNEERNPLLKHITASTASVNMAAATACTLYLHACVTPRCKEVRQLIIGRRNRSFYCRDRSGCARLSQSKHKIQSFSVPEQFGNSIPELTFETFSKFG